MLLKDNGFVQLVYSKYHHKCLKGEFLVIVNASLSPPPPPSGCETISKHYSGIYLFRKTTVF